MFDLDSAFGHQDAHDVELIQFAVAPVAVDPDAGAAGELPLFAVVDRFNWITELVSFARFHFDECDRRIALCDEIDIAPTVAKSAGEDAIAVFDEPSFGDAFAECAEALVVCGHGGESTGGHEMRVTARFRTASIQRGRVDSARAGRTRTLSVSPRGVRAVSALGAACAQLAMERAHVDAEEPSGLRAISFGLGEGLGDGGVFEGVEVEGWQRDRWLRCEGRCEGRCECRRNGAGQSGGEWVD